MIRAAALASLMLLAACAATPAPIPVEPAGHDHDHEQTSSANGGRPFSPMRFAANVTDVAEPADADLPPETAAAARVMRATCAANPQNAEEEMNFVCSLQSADLAHIEAGRGPVSSQGCTPGVPCAVPDDKLVVRILNSPATGMGAVPFASSIEITGFDKPQARVDVRELVGYRAWAPETDAPSTPPLMRRGSNRAFDLTPEATARILALAVELRGSPETASWMTCRLEPNADPAARAVVLYEGQTGGAFVQLFFGAESHAYLRNAAWYGSAGHIAALAIGANRIETRCRPVR